MSQYNEKDFIEKLASMSNEEIFLIANADASEYNEIAIVLAREELSRRRDIPSKETPIDENEVRSVCDRAGCSLRSYQDGKLAQVILRSGELIMISIGTTTVKLFARGAFLGWTFPRCVGTWSFLDVDPGWLRNVPLTRMLFSHFVLNALVELVSTCSSIAEVCRNVEKGRLDPFELATSRLKAINDVSSPRDFVRGKPKPSGLYSGGSGNTMEDAIIIQAASSFMGVSAEYDYVGMQCGRKNVDWTLKTQALLEPDGPDCKHYDLLTVKLKDGTLREFYFDISSFFNAPPLTALPTEQPHCKEEIDRWEKEVPPASQLRDLQQAIRDLDRAIELNPKDAGAYVVRGMIYNNLGDHRQAISDLDRGIELNPNDALAYGNRGIAYSKLAEHRRGIRDLDRAIQLNPKLAEAYVDRGVVFGKLGELHEAIGDYNKAIELNPKYAKAYYTRGVTYGKLGDLQQAIRDLKTAAGLANKEAQDYLRSQGISW